MSGVDLLALAARVEASAGADRELDAVIAAAVRYFPRGVGYVWQGSLTPNSPELGRVECCTSLGTGGPHYAAPAYTASLDAAMTLVPEGHVSPNDFVREAMSRLSVRFNLHICHWPVITPYPEYLARFITAAALRARHQSAAGEG